MSELLDLLRERRADTSERVAIARRNLLAAEAELREVERAIRAVEPDATRAREEPGNPPRRTMQECVLLVLAEAAGPLPSEEIRARVGALLDRRVERSSLAPQLSRLVRSGAIVRTDRGEYAAVSRGDGP